MKLDKLVGERFKQRPAEPRFNDTGRLYEEYG